MDRSGEKSWNFDCRGLREVENSNKLHQQLCGINKKEKLGLTAPSQEEVKKWTGK